MNARVATLLLLLIFLTASTAQEDDVSRYRSGLLAAYTSGSPEDRRASVKALTTFGNLESTRLLVSVIGRQQELIEALLQLREDVRRGRVKPPNRRLPELYLQDLKEELDVEYQTVEAIENAFARLGDHDPIGYLATAVLLRGKHWKAREIAARALGRIGERGTIPSLTKSAKEKDARVKTAVLTSLGLMRAEEALEFVLDALTDKDWMVRSAAIGALAKIRDPRAIDALIERMKEEEGRLVEDAAAALSKITGQDFGIAVDAWEAWWEKNRERALAGEDLEVPPKKEEPEEKRGPYYHGIPVRSHRTIFIIDVSESMTYSSKEFKEKPKPGEISRFELAKRELLLAIRNYPSDGTFALIAFHTVVKVWRPSLVKAKKGMKADAKEWIGELEAMGTTNVYQALEVAFRLAGMGMDRRHKEPVADTIYLLSDGAPTNEDATIDDPERVFRGVRGWNKLGRMKIHTIGLKGHSADFMRRLAQENGGTYVSRD